jgi:hypothetical protein
MINFSGSLSQNGLFGHIKVLGHSIHSSRGGRGICGHTIHHMSRQYVTVGLTPQIGRYICNVWQIQTGCSLTSAFPWQPLVVSSPQPCMASLSDSIPCLRLGLKKLCGSHILMTLFYFCAALVISSTVITFLCPPNPYSKSNLTGCKPHT